MLNGDINPALHLSRALSVHQFISNHDVLYYMITLPVIDYCELRALNCIKTVSQVS